MSAHALVHRLHHDGDSRHRRRHRARPPAGSHCWHFTQRTPLPWMRSAKPQPPASCCLGGPAPTCTYAHTSTRVWRQTGTKYSWPCLVRASTQRPSSGPGFVIPTAAMTYRRIRVVRSGRQRVDLIPTASAFTSGPLSSGLASQTPSRPRASIREASAEYTSTAGAARAAAAYTASAAAIWHSCKGPEACVTRSNPPTGGASVGGTCRNHTWALAAQSEDSQAAVTAAGGTRRAQASASARRHCARARRSSRPASLRGMAAASPPAWAGQRWSFWAGQARTRCAPPRARLGQEGPKRGGAFVQQSDRVCVFRAKLQGLANHKRG